MPNKMIRCGMLGGGEKDLFLLSELHRQEDVQIAFVYDSDRTAVAVEIAEILGIVTYNSIDELSATGALDYLIVTEPRARFADAIQALEPAEAQILNPGDAFQKFCDTSSPEPPLAVPVGDPYTIEDALSGLERLLDRGELLKFLLDVAVRASGARAGSIMLYTAEANELYIAYATGLSERVIKNTRQKLGEGIAGKVGLTKQAQLIHLPADSDLYVRDRMDISSAISVPLLWKGKLLGVLNVSSSKQDPPHGDDDLQRLKALSHRLSRVLFESQKIEEVRMRHRESNFRKTMGEIANKDITTREKFSVLARYLGELVGADTVELFVSTIEGDWFVLGGSSRLMGAQGQRLRYERGALSRAFLEKRCIVMTETSDTPDDPLTPLSSVVYCHLGIKDVGGVAVMEFPERSRLDEFLLIKDGITAEISRFASSELRERRLRHKVEALDRIADATPALLGCRSVEDLLNVLARVISDVLECERVSVRLQRAPDTDKMQMTFIAPPGEGTGEWQEEDAKQFKRLADSKEAFSLAFLDFESNIRDGIAEGHSLLAFPIEVDGEFYGGVIAASKRSRDPMEESIFTELDQSIMQNLNRLILPVLDSIYKQVPIGPAGEESYETELENNRERFRSLCDSEILRSNRYHHTFAVLMFELAPLEEMWSSTVDEARSLVDEVSQGLRTRTRKTDYGCWISPSRFAMLSLEGGNRVRFLISRAMMYLSKDLAGHKDDGVDANDILVGTAVYPGGAKTADDLIVEAKGNLKPYMD